MPRPAYWAALGVAIMATWSGIWLIGVVLVWLAASMNPERES